MTDEAFEALWFLYHITERELGEIARKGASKTSTLTHFHHAIHSALQRSNDTDTFIRALEKTVGLNFKQEYAHEFPTPESFAVLFRQLKKHSVLYYMAQLMDRARQEKPGTEQPTDTNVSQEATQ